VPEKPECIPVVAIFLTIGVMRRGEGTIGIKKEKARFTVMVNLFPQGLRDANFSTVLEQGTVQV
jgi:hypothetical protein